MQLKNHKLLQTYGLRSSPLGSLKEKERSSEGVTTQILSSLLLQHPVSPR